MYAPSPADNTVFSATGGAITTVMSGGIAYKVHTFTSVGTSAFQVITGTGNIEVLIVA